jgi:hypothetical protein
MSYNSSVFQNWTSFNTWADLKAWLTGAEGGSLRVVEPKDSDLVLVRYTKGTSDFTKPHVRWCRSVVLDKNTRKVVSVAPPKAVEFDTKNATVAEEFVDGTMMNIYYDSATQSVDVATRSRLGAYNQFYRDGPTFRSMLQDALVKIGVEDMKVLLPSTTQNCFTSVVVQHPANRVVKPVDSPVLSVIHQGTVASDGSVSFVEDPDHFQFSNSVNLDSVVVQEYTLDSIVAMPSLKDWVVAQSKEQGFGWQGVVLKDGQGGRWRVRSDVYETVRRLRGNESSVEDRFARIRKTRVLDQYLSFFPEDRQALYDLEGVLRANTRQLYHSYVSTFITHEKPYHELTWPYKHHVSVLHNLYKDMLKPHGKKMVLAEVVTYVNRLTVEDTANLLRPQTQKAVLAVPAAVPAEVDPAMPARVRVTVEDGQRVVEVA